jgi:hypothetical protein
MNRIKEMEMANKYDKENDKSRERLQKLLNSITDEELKYIIYKEGWTIAVMLGHIAFWDERRGLNLMEWKQNGITASGINELDTRIINDALVPFLLALAPRKAAGLALTAAEKVDGIIAGLSGELVKNIEGMGDEYALDRAKHRKMHLDEIDELLKAGRK